MQYLPDDLTKALLVRAGVDANRTHLVDATGAELPNDEIPSTSMVVYVLEKFGAKDITKATSRARSASTGRD